MGQNVLSIGFGNVVALDEVVAIVQPGSMPVKRLVAGADQRGKLVNATMGKKTRAVIVMKSDHVVLSGISAETIISRMENR